MSSPKPKRARLHQSALQTKLKLNIDLRIKYPAQPLKFVESEEELFLAIKNLDQLEQNETEVLLDLLDHENPDIVLATIERLSLLEIQSDEISDRLIEMFQAEATPSAALAGIVAIIGNLDRKIPINCLEKLLEFSLTPSLDAGEVFAQVFQGESEITARLLIEIDRLANNSDRSDDESDLLVSLLNAACTCTDFPRNMEIASTVLDAEPIELKEAALRVVAVVAASRPELIRRELSDRILPLLCVDQLSAVITELALEIFSRDISETLVESDMLEDVVVHYATATEKISELQELLGEKFNVEEAPGLAVANLAALVILKALAASSRMKEILEKVEIDVEELEAFALLR